MATWKKVKDIDHSIRSNGVSQAEGFWNTIMGKQVWYLKGVFKIHTKGALYIDQNNSKSYRIAATIYVQHYYKKTGGYWRSNAGDGIEVSFNNTVIYSGQVETPIDCWENDPNTDVKVVSFDKTFTVDKKGYLDVYVDVWQNGASRGQGRTDHDVPRSICKSDGTFDGVVGFQGTYSNFIDYEVPDPYIKPIISISASPLISIYNENRKVTVAKNTTSDTNETSVKITINGKENSTSIKNAGGDYTFKPSDNNVGQASSYKVKARRIHSKDSSLYKDSNELTLYTYKTPSITDFSLDPSTTSGNGGGNIKWSCNNKKWESSSLETNFKTYIYDNITKQWNEASNHKPTETDASNIAQSQAITKTWIESILDDNARCVDSKSFKIKMRRKNESSGKVADTGELTLTVNFKPTKTMGDNSILYYDCNSDNTTPNLNNQLFAGREYYIDEHPYVYVKWIYPSDVDGGVISGYEFNVYDSSSCDNSIYYKNVSTTSLTTGVPLNIKTNLVRGVVNYVGIKPYYIDPKGTKRYGPESTKQFIKPIGKLSKPVIDGPINGTNWHNNQFRILVTSPEDADFDVLGVLKDDYRYKEIQVKINNKTYSFTNSNHNLAFSTNTVSYKKALIINPSLIQNFEDVDKYTISIRYQKNYYSNVWSEWSNEVTINKNIINELTTTEGIKREEYIMLTHYNTVQGYSVRLYDVYFINRNNVPNTNIKLSTQAIIKAENYQGIYDTILQIQNKVNNYAVCDNDRQNVKFNKDINNFANDNKPKRGEIITQDKIQNIPVTGRNYMNICIECMNKLSN